MNQTTVTFQLNESDYGISKHLFMQIAKLFLFINKKYTKI